MLTLLSNIRLFTPAPHSARHLLIADGRIAALLDEPPSIIGVPVEVIDLGGQRLIPGLVDGHAHLTGGGGEAGPHTKVPPVPLSRFTRGGVTTAVGVLGTDDVTRTTGELVTAVYALRNEGLSAWCHTGGYHLPPTTLTGTVRGDIAFVEPIIGVGEIAISDHRSSQPTLDELLRLAADAHVGGLMTGKAGILHLHVGDGRRGLTLIREALAVSELPPRVFNPTHVNRRTGLMDEAIALARLGVTVDCTAFPVTEGEDAYAADVAIRRYLESGAPVERITCSSDGGGCLPVFDGEGRVASMDVGDPGALAGCVADLLSSGVPLETALLPFTSNPARLLRLPRKGHIAIGADADLVALDELGGITDVMCAGRWQRREGTMVHRGTFDREQA